MTCSSSDDDSGGVFSQDLMSAVLNGHLDDAKKLIEEGANVNAEDVHGNTVSACNSLSLY